MNILIVSGGTGGHIFPAIALGKELKSRGYNISFVTNDSISAVNMIETAGFNYEVLSVPKMPYGFSINWLIFFPKLLLARYDAEDLIRLLNPNIVVGFGAYISGPIVSVAKSNNIKTIIHEQNVSLGRANKILLKKADKVFLSFSHRLMDKSKKYIVTGNPLRPSLLEGLKSLTKAQAKARLGLSRNKKTILVLGGSRGAPAINSLIMKVLVELDELQRKRIQIIHVCGKKDLEQVSREYRISGVEHVVNTFYETMHIYYKAADLIICRAGATTASEIAVFGLPAILIPYPWAGYHQKDNAEAIAGSGGAVVVEENRISPKELRSEIFDIIDNEEKMREMSSSMRSLAKIDAASKMSDQIEELLNA
ncbi:MAG: undecaprenyldiphospho-muramoylpentapeptide beta-N-acetylglucosaminyltransferase [Candidatus Omnitrophica bacterium]|nr:undecaprenyldiphospho-muramoylpentapeptide beta-N-acetylglucosaminyltransferase [Candidatus Omnitrophota bacterium]